jgi:hypothetical protein
MRGNRHLGWQFSLLIEENNTILPKPNNLQKLHNKTEKRTSSKVGDKNLIQNLNLIKSKIFILPKNILRVTEVLNNSGIFIFVKRIRYNFYAL